MRVLFLADRCVQRQRLARELQHLPDLVGRQVHLLADLVGRRLASQLLYQDAAGANQLVHRLDHVDRNADRAGLVGNRARDRLADPPGRVRRELVAALVVELVDGLHEADVAFLDHVEELQAAVRVLLPDRHDEAQVGLDQRRLGPVRDALAAQDLAHGLPQHGLRQAGLFLDLLDLLARVGDHLRHRLDLLGAQPQLLRDRPLPQRRRADLAHRLLELLERQPGFLLARRDLAAGLLDPRDELLEPANDPIDRLLVEAHLQQRLQDLRLLLAGPGVQLPEPPDPLDRLADAVDVPLLVELGILLVDVANDLLDADLPLAQLVGEPEDLLDRNRRVQHHLQHAPVAVLDPLGDLDLALTREQRDRPHLAHVHAHRIAGPRGGVGVLFLLGLLRLDFDLGVGFGLRVVVLVGRGLALRRRLDDLDALVGERRKPVLHLTGRRRAFRHALADLVVGQKALGLADRDQLALVALAILLGSRALLALLGALLRSRPAARDGWDALQIVGVFGFVFDGNLIPSGEIGRASLGFVRQFATQIGGVGDYFWGAPRQLRGPWPFWGRSPRPRTLFLGAKDCHSRRSGG